jgi:DNA-binding NtrC family response regulator
MLPKHAAPRTIAKASDAVRQQRPHRTGENSHIRREISRAPVVLIVERDALLRWALYETLTTAGFRVLAAPGTACAEAWLHQIDQELSLALIEDDVWPLPGRVKAVLEARWPTLPIVVMLHGANPAIEARVRAHGATEVLVKPFDLPDLVDLAERLTSDIHPPAGARVWSPL